MKHFPICLFLLAFCFSPAVHADGTIAFSGDRQRNNLVADLLEVTAITKSDNSFAFKRERAGWIFISAAYQGNGTLDISLESPAAGSPIALTPATKTTGNAPLAEYFRHVESGSHTLRVACGDNVRVDRLIVRAIPELVHCGLNSSSIKSYGPFDLKFLEKDVLPNVTSLIVSTGIQLPQSVIDDWHKQGRRFIGEVGLNREGKTGQADFDFYTKYFDNAPYLDGLIINEFGMNRIARPPNEVVRARAAARHQPYEEAFRMIRGNPRYQQKTIYAYFGGSGNVVNYDETGMTFVRTLIDLKYPIALERYIYERPAPEASAAALQRFVDGIADWESKEPGAKQNMLLTFGLFDAPPGGSNKLPNVDFHVYMDQQMNVAATNFVLAGLAGLNWWTANQADEDSVRFVGKLYRHYGIEGNTEPLTKDPLFLTHIQNADFENGLEGWTLQRAEEGSIDSKSFPRYGRIEGRYPRDRDPIGDKFLVMKRSEKGPNKFSQTIKNLEPGRIYSMKMFTCDYNDLITPQQKEPAAAPKFIGKVTLDGVDIDTKRSFQELYASNPEPKIPVWITYHWTIFKAKGTTAELTVSDWPQDKEINPTFGQEQTFNFIEIQPYRE